MPDVGSVCTDMHASAPDVHAGRSARAFGIYAKLLTSVRVFVCAIRKFAQIPALEMERIFYWIARIRNDVLSYERVDLDTTERIALKQRKEKQDEHAKRAIRRTVQRIAQENRTRMQERYVRACQAIRIRISR